MVVVCADDSKTERHGFLWLKKRVVQIPGLTKGKRYGVIRKETAVYGSAYVQTEFSYYLIVDDRSIMQLHPVGRFVPNAEHNNVSVPESDSNKR